MVITINTSLYLCKIRVFLDLLLSFIYLAYGIHGRWVITIQTKFPFSRLYKYRNSRFSPVFSRLLEFPVFPIITLNSHPGKTERPLALLRTSDFKLLFFSTSVKHWKTAFQDCARWNCREVVGTYNISVLLIQIFQFTYYFKMNKNVHWHVFLDMKNNIFHFLHMMFCARGHRHVPIMPIG